jgi:hypothetical protein
VIPSLAIGAAAASADTFPVINNNNSGAGSLPAAITAANANGNGSVVDQIPIQVTGNIDLEGQLPQITTPMTINGPGANVLSIRRSAAALTQFRFIAVSSLSPTDTVHIEGITFSGARAAGFSGGAVDKGGPGSLGLDSLVFNDNRATAGGAVFYDGPGVTIENSTLSANSATGGSGGAIQGRSFATTNGAATVINSTITGNSTTEFGGGVDLIENATITVNSSTIVGNTANSDNNAVGSGGGIRNNSSGGPPAFSVANTLLAGNAVGTSPPAANQCNGAFVSSDYNLSETDDLGCTGFNGPHDVILNANPMLGTPGDNGGPTPTIALLTGSAAIGIGNPATPGGAFPACPATDQRGLSRGGAAGVCDIGAFEVAPDPTSTVVGCAPAMITLGSGSSVCTATVSDTFLPTSPTGSVSFGSSGTGTFTSGGSCALAMLDASQARCSVTYTPTAVGTGSHQITGSYAGDVGHDVSQDSAVVGVLSLPAPTPTPTPIASPPGFDPGASIKKCKKKFRKGPKRKKCIKRAKKRAQA